MRPQARPFMVEVKTRHSRGQNAKSTSSQGAIRRPAASPERPSIGNALEEASRLFSGLVSGSAASGTGLGKPLSVALTPNASGQPAQSNEGAQRRRVLPSLNTRNPEAAEEPTVGPALPQRPAKRPARSKKSVTPPEQDEPVTVLKAEPEQFTTAEPAPERSEYPTIKRRVQRRGEARVPLGERWKRRRLPQICW
jgi:hypothetical protein